MDLMELMPKGTLQTRLEKRRILPLQEVLAVGLSLCRALKVAHSRGIIHRDIKPGNILLGDEDVIKLADFGIAHLPEKYGGLGATRLGCPHPCTPAYASPEQVRGSKLDGRSDLYSVGVVLYELVTGSFYFDRRLCHDLNACFEAVVTLDPIPPRRLNPNVPSRLDEIIMRLLQKAPGERHTDATALIHDLESVLPTQAAALGTVKSFVASVSTTAQREEGGIRYRIRAEAENRGEKTALWSGLTINLPSISSRETLSGCQLNVWCSREGSPVLRAPGDTLYGFRGDGSFGEMEATCLLVETPSTPWKPGERVSLEVSLFLCRTGMEAHVRTWATWENDEEVQTTNGDPDWAHRGLRDQQGIPAYRVSVSLQPE